ncbi:MAG: hypothetical protein JNN27_17355 [Planctomycetes bacterium]|nr:hypothetical protein [Planctomycetota bacterium]
MSRRRLHLLAFLALCAACGDSTAPVITGHEHWLERIEFALVTDPPEVLIVWDNLGYSGAADSVQFAMWSHGRAVWHEGEVRGPVIWRKFQCTTGEMNDLRAALAAQLPVRFLRGAGTTSSPQQLILWRPHASVRGVSTDAFLESSGFEPPTFERVLDPQAKVDAEQAPKTLGQFAPQTSAAVQARLAIEAAISALVRNHPEAQPTWEVHLVDYWER